MEAHAPKRYSGVSDTTQKGETKMKQETKARIRVVGRILFLVYIFLRSFIFCFCRRIREKKLFELDYRYNLVPFQEIRRFWIYREKVGFLAAFLNLAGNVIGFSAVRLYCSGDAQKMRVSGKYRFLVLCSVSAWRRFSSSRRWGCFDVDDLILRSLGAMIGCGAFLICNKFQEMEIWRGERSIVQFCSEAVGRRKEALLWQGAFGFFVFFGFGCFVAFAETGGIFSYAPGLFSFLLFKDAASMWGNNIFWNEEL